MSQVQSEVDGSVCGGCSSSNDDELVSLDRRQAIGTGVLGAVASLLGGSLLGACASGQSKPAVAATPVAGEKTLGHWMLQVRLADFPALANKDGMARIDGGSDKPVAIVRTADGYAAFSLRCPHAGGTVEVGDGGFVCPNHGAKFSPQGTWTGGHAAKNLRGLGVTYDAGNGLLTVLA